MESRMVMIREIQIGERARQDLGDLGDLRDSIGRFGLLQPPIVTPDLRLIAGHRRIEACRALDKLAIPVVIAAHLTDAADLLRAERDENTCRLPMAVSELISLGRQIEELERPKAKAAQAHGQTAPGKGVNAFVPRDESVGSIDSREAAANAIGLGSGTYSRMKQVANGAEGYQESRGVRIPVTPERQAESKAALALIDRVSRGEEIRPSHDERPLTVTAIYKQWKASDDPKNDDIQTPAEPRPTVRDEEPHLSPALGKNGRRLPGRSARKSVSEGLAALDGLCAGFDRFPGFDEPLNTEEAERWLLGLTENMRVLRALHKQIKEHVHGSH